jgi:CubicO group peptidase (beta-lactamase class C family)
MMQAQAATTRVFPEADWLTATPESQGVDSRKLLEALATLKEITDAKNHEVTHHDGITQTVVIRHGAMIWHGPDIDALHEVWSCTKSFVSLCMGLLTDEGKVSPDTLAADILPGMGNFYPAVTLRQMAGFISGYRGAEEGDTLRVFEPGEPYFAPGTHYHYSHATDMLAYLLTRVAGEPLRDLFRRRIAEPIGMDARGWRWTDWGEVDGRIVCGGTGMYGHVMHITARQMARVGWLLVNRGQWNGRTIVSREYIEDMTTVQAPPTTPPFEKDGWYVRLPGSYGLNIWLNGVTPDGKRMWPAAPAGVAAIQGNMNNICFAIPEWDMVVVRMGTDGRINNNRYTEVFAALREAALDLA